MNCVPLCSRAAAASAIHSQTRLRLPEDVLRVHRLVRRDEDEALAAELGGDLGDHAGAEDVVPDRLDRVRLHERHVFVGGRVEDDPGPEAVERAPHLGAVLHVGEDGNRRVEAALVGELALDVDERVLRVVDEDDAVGAERGDLAAELGADRAARAGDEDGLAGDVGGDRGEVELDGLAPEHVLHLHLAELAREVEVAGDELVHGGQGLHRDADVAALVHDPLPRLARRGRDRDDDLVRAVVAKEVRQVVGRAEHPDAVEAQVLLAGIVVDEPGRRVAEVRVLQHLAEDELARVAGSHDEHVSPPRDEPPPARALEDRPRGEAGARDEPEQDQPVDDDDPAREPEARHGVPEVERGDRDDGRDGDRQQGAPDVADRDVAPPVVVQAEDDEGEDLHADDDEDHVEVEERLVARRNAVVEADVEGEDPRQGDEPRVHDRLPEPVPVERSHQAAFTVEAARRHSTTRSCCSREMAGQIGSARVSRAARSVSGRLPCS